MRAGIRYVWNAVNLRVVVLRTILFAIPASAIWALLPLVSKDRFSAGSLTYGILLGGLGAGALIGAWALPIFRQITSLENIVGAASVALAVSILGVAITRSMPLLLPLMLFGGVGWLTLLASLNAATRMQVPQWVEGRALSIYLVAFQGSIAIGSFLWGLVATSLGVRGALFWASGILASTAFARLSWKLPTEKAPDLIPAGAWPDPEAAPSVNTRRGPTFVVVEYRVNADRLEAFNQAIGALRTFRLRDGAFQWGIFVDTTDPTNYIEEFMVESWVEHLRQHMRLTRSDRQVQEAQIAFLALPPKVSHYVSGATRLR